MVNKRKCAVFIRISNANPATNIIITNANIYHALPTIHDIVYYLFMFMLLVVITNPYLDLDYDQINVYHINENKPQITVVDAQDCYECAYQEEDNRPYIDDYFPYIFK